jgi:hypothetical protein
MSLCDFSFVEMTKPNAKEIWINILMKSFLHLYKLYKKSYPHFLFVIPTQEESNFTFLM